MIIGFDAKRAFFNSSGLGNYSRNSIRLLGEFYPENEYILYTPSDKNTIKFPINNNTSIVTPSSVIGSIAKSYWRSVHITKQIIEDKLDVFHGLSNEIPTGLEKTKVKSLITIHDLIFIRYPELYKHVDRNIYIKKVKNGCKYADNIIAISEQTKSDLINFINIPEEKIDVVYQGCNPIFYNKVENKEEIRKKLSLPEKYLLYVGTIEKRKNLLKIIKALKINKIEIPLVVVGRKTNYFNEVEIYIQNNNLGEQVSFYHNIDTKDLPAIYQMAEIFIYPSIFEGFGIPIIEALNSGTPVITSLGSCFSEAGGPNSIYINPEDQNEIAEAIDKIMNDDNQKEKMIVEGLKYVKKFNDEEIASELMNIYLK